MSSNGRTEDHASYIEILPTEDIWRIASFCDHWDIVALASTSSHMRFKVLPLIHKQVWFSGQECALQQQLQDFLGRGLNKPRIDGTISSTTISVCEKPSPCGLWAGLYADSFPTLRETKRTLPIFEVLQAMPNLRSLSLHLKFLTESQEIKLYNDLQKAKEIKIQYLRIDSSMSVMERLLSSCSALTTLDIDHAVKLGQLQNIPPSVKRLAVTLHPSMYKSMVYIPSLCVENIRHIVRLNSGLEELILRDSEEEFEPFDPSAIEDGRGLDELFKDTLREAAEELTQLPKLKRLAINIWESTPSQIRIDSQPASLNVSKLEWIYNWYEGCIQSLGEALPHLQQICILCEFPAFWRGSRQMPEGTFYAVKAFKGDRQKFPGTLDRYSPELGLRMDQW